MVLIDEEDKDVAVPFVIPSSIVGKDSGDKILSYINHTSEESRLVLEGRHNADIGWISELRMNGDALVLPWVVLEAFPAELLRKKKQWDKAIDLIVKECKDMGNDGIVLESWSRWATYGVLQDPDLCLMVLVCAPSNVAVDQLAEKISATGLKMGIGSALETLWPSLWSRAAQHVRHLLAKIADYS